MPQLVDATGPILDQILDATHAIWHEGLGRAAYAQFWKAQLATAWGRSHLQRWAIVDGHEVLASAKLYTFDASLDGRPIRVAGIGAVFTQPARRGQGHAARVITAVLDRAQANGADLALLFSEIGADYYARLGFIPVPTFDALLTVLESTRRGAPATLVRAGEERDVADLVAIGRALALPYAFHLDRDRDLLQYALAKKRLLAGLGPPGAREVQFFVAEEGASAVAYLVITAHHGEWTIEEMGDRDPAGARVGAILQVLLARDPAERRPRIRAWVPHGFCPPQVRIASRQPSSEIMMIRPLTANGTPPRPLTQDDILYWRSDIF